jgi:uracil-DNA glycosylase family protein
MAARQPPDSAARFIPPDPDLSSLRQAAAGCTACPLHLTGTQTVFGAGPADAPLMMVGEQPGDVEDVQGLPFVGPAGRLLDGALAEAGIDRSRSYLTNVVKHFKWVQRGRRRIHEKPGSMEILACRPWLDAEIALVKPQVLLCLGATAAQALLGRDFRVSRDRGIFLQSALAPYVMATVHPSSILRAPDEAVRQDQMVRFVNDLRKVAEVLPG